MIGDEMITTMQPMLPYESSLLPQCLWCGRPVPEGHICLHELNLVFAYTMTIGGPPVGQCAWCGLITSGPYAGKRALTHSTDGYGNLIPDLAIGESHGICSRCAGSVLTTRKRVKIS